MVGNDFRTNVQKRKAVISYFLDNCDIINAQRLADEENALPILLDGTQIT